jgi:putative aminopeptidase FrvX
MSRSSSSTSGMESGDDAKKQASRSATMSSWTSPASRWATRSSRKALDNRVACWLGIESGPQARQERRGARVRGRRRVHDAGRGRAARREDRGFAVKPDIGIGIDVTLACDTPGVPESERSPSTARASRCTSRTGRSSATTARREVEKLAKKKRIKYQRSILAAGGQDGAAAQQAAAGAKSRRHHRRHAVHPHRDRDDRHTRPGRRVRHPRGVPHRSEVARRLPHDARKGTPAK